MTTSIFSGRSRHGRTTARSKPVARKRPSKPREEGADDEGSVKPEKLDIDELRRRRLLYLSVSPESRRRAAATTATKPKPKEHTLSHARTTGGEHKRRKRRHKSSSARRNVDSKVDSKTDDYVYGSSRPSYDRRQDDDNQLSRSKSARRSKNPGSSSRSHSLPVVVESEVTPDDSISQVGVQRDAEPVKYASSSRSLRRSPTSQNKLATISEKSNDDKSIATTSRRSSRHPPQPSLLGLLRRNTAPAVPTAPRLVECLTCAADDVPYAKSAKLSCGHRMCHDCLKRIFEMSVKDPAHMPPRCCTNDHIPLQHVDKLFDLKFKMLWNRKYQEFHTKNRIYCPAPKCGEWIKPTHIHTSQGKKYAQCPRCQTKVCTLCNAKLHKSKECPKDPEIAKLVEQAKENGWKSCYNCNAMVELSQGCNHMTCRCMAEFCMICGAKWKTCDCPWFNYTQLPDPDRLMEWRVPEPIQAIYRRAFGAPDPQQVAPPPPPLEVPGLPDAPLRGQRQNRRGQSTYTEEIDQRRRQVRLDADLARRLQLATLLEPDDEPPGNGGNRRRRDSETWGLGNAGGHFMNDDFVQNAANVVMGAFGDPVMGQRGERTSARRRRTPRAPSQEDNDAGLVYNFLGDESVLGAGPRTS